MTLKGFPRGSATRHFSGRLWETTGLKHLSMTGCQAFEILVSRYLASKQSVDDRSLNHCVWQRLISALSSTKAARPLRLLEIGAGIGTMLERLLEQVSFSDLNYTLLDINAACLEESRQRITQGAIRQGCEPVWRNDGTLQIATESGQQLISFIHADIFDFIRASDPTPGWDVILANAFMDLVDCGVLLPDLCHRLRAGGLLHLSLNYDGETIFLPVLDNGFDRHVIELYHQSMDARIVQGRPSGDRYTGRHLLAHVTAAGAELLAAGSSDWVVFPHAHRYFADEAYFLHAILHTVETELRRHRDLDSQRFSAWIAHRHHQVETGELIYIAKNLDLLARIGKVSFA
jgi:SAM-dependent methyltransferase